MFGNSLGTGDYGHLTVEHVPMLFRSYRSLHHLWNQGFEAAHKLQRQLYTRATSHDSSSNTSSCKFLSLKKMILYLQTGAQWKFTMIIYLNWKTLHWWIFFFCSVSVDQILTHLYTEMLLEMRLEFREARRCITSGEKSWSS